MSVDEAVKAGIGAEFFRYVLSLAARFGSHAGSFATVDRYPSFHVTSRHCREPVRLYSCQRNIENAAPEASDAAYSTCRLKIADTPGANQTHLYQFFAPDFVAIAPVRGVNEWQEKQSPLF